MVNGVFHLFAGSHDFTFERGDARFQFGDRQRIEVLPDQLGQCVIRTRRGVVQVHAGANVDRGADDVNKDATFHRPIGMPVIPETMRAIDPEQPGGPEVLTIVERPVPIPGEGEVLVKVAAAGINRPEVMQRKGLYPPPPGAPSIPGLELSGSGIGSVAVKDLLAGAGELLMAAPAAGFAPPFQSLPLNKVAEAWNGDPRVRYIMRPNPPV